MNLPSEQQIYELHKKICPAESKQLLDIVWNHCVIVKDISMLVVDYLEQHRIDVNRELVVVGALVHDVGVYKCLNNKNERLQPYIRHGVEGESILLEEGYPYKIARFASHHTGVGITIEDIENQNLPLNKDDYIPVTLEEEVVAYADKFHSKKPCFNSYESQQEALAHHNGDNTVKLTTFKKKFGIPDLTELKKQYEKWQQEFKWGD
ncbi:MAG: HD domain-containing protein [Patescibacteria group bacterium]